MEDRKLQFLQAVLGEDGALALSKAAERSEVLDNALVPRTILAWIGSAPVFEGCVPGVEDVYVVFSKSDAGFSGSVTMQDGLYTFLDESLFHVAATVAVAMGIEQEHVHPDLRAVDIERLGKSIDLLAKARRAAEELEKSGKFCPGCTFKKDDKHVDGCEKTLEKSAIPAYLPKDCCWCDKDATHFDASKDDYKPRLGEAKHGPDTACEEHKNHLGDHAKPILRVVKDELEKAKEGPGMNAAPIAPQAPTAPTATAPQQPQTTKPMAPPKPKVAKPATSPTFKLTQSEANHRCPACGIAQFEGISFTGCLCFSDLAKGAKVVASDGETVTIRLDKTVWDAEAVLTFLEAVGRG